METTVFQKLNQLAEELQPEVVKFAQKLIQTPSISGTEGSLSELLLAEMKKLRYDDYFRDEQGNIIGIVNGTEAGPTIMYNSHMDHVSPGDHANWEGYDPYGGLIDTCAVDNQDKTEKEMAEWKSCF